jgi:hypothetical protein
VKQASPGGAPPRVNVYPSFGRVAERTKATVLKTVRGESPSRVRIPVLPLHPPVFTERSDTHALRNP